MKSLLRKTEVFIRRKIVQYGKKYYTYQDQKRLHNHQFVIISNNCFGGQVYQWLGKTYNTPFVGLYLNGPCYLKLLQNFDYYLKQDLEFIQESIYPKTKKHWYPIGKLDDIEVHFSHYDSQEEAMEKWTRRKKRMLETEEKNRLFPVLVERDNVDEQIVKEFHKIPFENKLSFSCQDYQLSAKENIVLHQKCKERLNSTPNGKKVFKLAFLYIDIVHWLNTGVVTRTHFKK